MLSGLQILWWLYLSGRAIKVYAKRNRFFDARVYRLETLQFGSLAVKEVLLINRQAAVLLKREHQFLTALNHKSIIKCRGHTQLPGHYLLATQWIDGYCLEGNLARLRQELTAPEDLTCFVDSCQDILITLQKAGIVHRDIRAKNIIVHAKQPVLFDFGWAIWKNEAAAFTPQSLNNPNDEDAMQDLVEQLSQ